MKKLKENGHYSIVWNDKTVHGDQESAFHHSLN